MATEAVSKAAPKAAKKSNRLTLVFKGRFAPLLAKIETKAEADTRDPDTTAMLILEAAFAVSPGANNLG